MKIITITTDFGTKDPYVGIMKGVILSINPGVHIVDITHEIGPANIIEGAYVLKEAYRFFPKGAIHIGVVDPGVGGNRRPIAIKTEDFFFVGPDNGLFWPIIEQSKVHLVIHLTNKKYFLPSISSTFHGRDIFAPVAAYISRGADLNKMGSIIHDPVILELEKPVFLKDRIIGQVIRRDHFGNLITNISEQDIIKLFGDKDGLKVEVSDISISCISKAYSDVGPGELLAIIGSSGFLEISANLARASDIISKGFKGLKVQVKKLI